jgi:hypothetical protein
LTRAGILSGGALAFVALVIACVAHQQGRLLRIEIPRILDRPLETTGAPTAIAATTLMPMLRAVFDGTSLVLTGQVPDNEHRDSIAENARRLYGANRVTNQLSVIPGVIGAATSFSAFPPDLREARRAIAILQDGRLLVSGHTDTDLARARFEAKLKAATLPGLQLDLRLNTDDVEMVGTGDAAPPRPATSATAHRAIPARQ